MIINKCKKKSNKKKLSKKFKKNKKFRGFTLTELLAVIIILGILMMLAIPSVTSVLEKAKEETFKEYAEKIAEDASKNYLKDTIEDTSDSCHEYDVAELSLDDSGSYDGYVLVVTSDEEQIYYITMWDDNHYIKEVNLADIDKTEWLSTSDTDNFNEARSNPFPTVKALYDSCASVKESKYFSGTAKDSSKSSYSWTAKYENGKMTYCYFSPTTYTTRNGNIVDIGGEEYYCAGKFGKYVGKGIPIDEFDGPSIECCTASSNGKPYYPYFPESGLVGYYDANEAAQGAVGGNLPLWNFE